MLNLSCCDEVEFSIFSPRFVNRLPSTRRMARLIAAVLLANAVLQTGGQAVGTVTTIAGGGGGTVAGHQDGVGTNALFSSPAYTAVDAAGTVVAVVSGLVAIQPYYPTPAVPLTADLLRRPYRAASHTLLCRRHFSCGYRGHFWRCRWHEHRSILQRSVRRRNGWARDLYHCSENTRTRTTGMVTMTRSKCPAVPFLQTVRGSPSASLRTRHRPLPCFTPDRRSHAYIAGSAQSHAASHSP